VDGGPGLLQALRGRYGHVEVRIDSLSSGPLRLTGYSADLGGVHLSFHDLLDGSTERVFVEQAIERAVLTYDDLDRYLRSTGRDLAVEPAGDGQLRLAGTVDVLGRVRMVSALARAEPEGGALLVQPVRLDSDEPLDGVERLLVAQRFTFPVPLDPLLLEQRTVEVAVRPSGLAVRTSGSDVVLGS
jgi:hypothetical protein